LSCSGETDAAIILR